MRFSSTSHASFSLVLAVDHRGEKARGGDWPMGIDDVDQKVTSRQYRVLTPVTNSMCALAMR